MFRADDAYEAWEQAHLEVTLPVQVPTVRSKPRLNRFQRINRWLAAPWNSDDHHSISNFAMWVLFGPITFPTLAFALFVTGVCESLSWLYTKSDLQRRLFGAPDAE